MYDIMLTTPEGFRFVLRNYKRRCDVTKFVMALNDDIIDRIEIVQTLGLVTVTCKAKAWRKER